MPKRTLRMELINQPAFWAAHLWNVTRGPLAGGDPEIADAGFGISTDAIEAFYLRELSNEQDWPYFCVQLRSGFSVEIEYANVPEDHEVIYRVSHNDWPSEICVGKGGGHWLLPAFRWTELLQISRVVAETHGERAGAHALLLLFPAMWLTKDEDLNEVRYQLLSAWNALSLLLRSQAKDLVERLVTACQSDVRWQRDEQHGWVNDGNNSCRNPNSPSRLSGEDSRNLLAFLMAIDKAALSVIFLEL